MSLLIYTHGGGRFGNQVLNYAHLLAFAQEQRGTIGLLNVAFWPYAEFCTGTARNPFCVSHTGAALPQLLRPFSGLRGWGGDGAGYSSETHNRNRIHFFFNRLPRCGSIYAPVYREHGEFFDLAEPGFVAAVRGNRVTCLAGWPVRQWQLLAKHEGAVRNFLTFADQFAKPARAFIERVRQSHDFLVGVLIRRDDYTREPQRKQFNCTIAQYLQAIAGAFAIYGGRAPCAVIASDEPQEAARFSAIPFQFTTGMKGNAGHYLESLIELSLCDVIISVPSTFTAWASYAGMVPLIPLSVDSRQLRSADAVAPSLEAMRQHALLRQVIV